MAIKKPEEIVFDEQAFMWDFISEFKNVVDGKAVRYKNFIQLIDSKPSVTLNKIAAQGADALEGFTNSQLAGLLPKMRLFKVVGEIGKSGGVQYRNNIEFPFNKSTSVESIVNSVLGRGTDAGIKQVTIRDTGTNPFNVGVAFDGELELFFQSFEAIFKERGAGEDKISFADLLNQAEVLGKQVGEKQNSEQISTNEPSFKKFKIRLELGWHPPQDPENVLGFTEEQLKHLETLTRSYILENYDQVIDINQQDASVNLRINFTAAIEGLTHSPRTDILYIDESNQSNKDLIKKREELEKNIKTLRESKKESIKNHEANRKAREEPVGMSSTDGTSTVAPTVELPPDLAESEIADLEGQIRNINYKIRRTISETRSISYKRLLNNLRNNFSNNGENSSGKIRYFTIPPEAVTAYKNILISASESVNEKKVAVENNKDIGARQEEINKIEEEYLKKRSESIQAVKKQIQKLEMGVAENSKIDTLLPTKDNQTLPKNLRDEEAPPPKEVSNVVDPSETAGTNNPVNQGKLTVHYFYLGDLIESIFDIIYNRPLTVNGSRKGRNTQTKNKKLYESLKMMLGPFSYYNPLTKKSETIQMADIPVTFSYFNAWFYDNVVKNQLTIYNLRNLMSDLCSKLLTNILAPERVGVLAQTSSYEIRLQSINLNENSSLNKYWLARRDKFKQRLDVNTYKVFAVKKENSASKNVSEWLYLYVTGDAGSFLANEAENTSFTKQNNIPRYYIGGQTGLLRSISFKKSQLPMKKEWALTKESNPVRANLLFQDKYDASVELFGNPTLKPGMLIYLDPRGLGLGNINTTNKTNFQYELGIGGYYRIVNVTSTVSDGRFTTSLEATAEFDLRDIQLIKQKKQK